MLLTGILMLIGAKIDVPQIIRPLLLVAAAVIAAIGLGANASIMGPRALGRIAMIVGTVIAACMSMVADDFAQRMMLITYLTGAMDPIAVLIGMRVAIAVAALLGGAAAIVSYVCVWRARVVSRSISWILPLSLLVGIAAASTMSVIVVTSVMSWATYGADLLDLSKRVQTAGVLVLGLITVATALLGRRRTAIR